VIRVYEPAAATAATNFSFFHHALVGVSNSFLSFFKKMEEKLSNRCYVALQLLLLLPIILYIIPSSLLSTASIMLSETLFIYFFAIKSYRF
jgi:hypothetical protein